MTYVLVFKQPNKDLNLRDFLKDRILEKSFQDDGWEYYIQDGESGETLFFTKKGTEFGGEYAKIDPEKHFLIQVFDSDEARLVRDLVEGYSGIVLIEIVG